MHQNLLSDTRETDETVSIQFTILRYMNNVTYYTLYTQ